jgi:mRNA interferase RelE/StbE
MSKRKAKETKVTANNLKSKSIPKMNTEINQKKRGFIPEKRFLKLLNLLPKKEKTRVKILLDQLAEDPRPEGSKKLVGSDFVRVRVGDFRIVYSMEDQKLVVHVLKVAHRREVSR